MEEILNTEINDFLMGRDPMERIVNIECGYMDDTVSIIFYDEKNNKKLTRDNFYPFIWANQSIARKMFGGDKNKIQEKALHRRASFLPVIRPPAVVSRPPPACRARPDLPPRGPFARR